MRPALVCLLGLGLAGLAHAALGPRYGGELTVGLPELPASLAPASPRDAASRLLLGLVHETLTGLTADGFPVPGLVAGWTSGAGGRELTLTLREGARSHDDHALEATDAVRSVRRFLRSPGAAASHFAHSLEGGAGYRSGETEDLPGVAVAGRGVVLRLRERQALPLAPLSSPAAAVTAPGGAGFGPFVPTVALPGRLGLAAFGAHVRGRPYLDRVQVAALAEETARRAAVAAGRVDLASGEPGVSALAGTLLLVLDPGRAPFRDPGARAVVASAFDRASLASLVPGASPVPSLLVPALLPPLGRQDPPRGGSLAGSPTLAVGTDVPPLASQRVVAHLEALGLRTRVLPASPAHLDAVPAEARLTVWLPEVPEPGLALEELARLAPESAAVRAALDAAAVESDSDRRRVHLHRAEEALRALHVLVPLGAVPVQFGGRRAVHGLRMDLSGRLLLEDAWVEP